MTFAFVTRNATHYRLYSCFTSGLELLSCRHPDSGCRSAQGYSVFQTLPSLFAPPLSCLLIIKRKGLVPDYLLPDLVRAKPHPLYLKPDLSFAGPGGPVSSLLAMAARWLLLLALVATVFVFNEAFPLTSVTKLTDRFHSFHRALRLIK